LPFFVYSEFSFCLSVSDLATRASHNTCCVRQDGWHLKNVSFVSCWDPTRLMIVNRCYKILFSNKMLKICKVRAA
jgi:hypothetical protein